MKKVLLLLTLSVFGFNAFSQYNFYKLSASVNAGGTYYFGDLTDVKPSYAGAVDFDFNLTPFATIGLQVQKGQFGASDIHLRNFKNQYMAVNLNGKLMLGQVVDFEASNFLYAIRNLYVGTGLGYIKSKQNPITRTKMIPDGKGGEMLYTFPGETNGSSLFIPLNVGYRFNLIDRFGFNRYHIDLNYQFNTAMKDNLDGYQDPATWKNEFKDFYSVFSIGVGIAFGPEGLY